MSAQKIEREQEDLMRHSVKIERTVSVIIKSNLRNVYFVVKCASQEKLENRGCFGQAQSTEETGQQSETEPTPYSLSIRYIEERGTAEMCSESVRSRLARGRCRKVLEGRKLFYRENILVITVASSHVIIFYQRDLTTVVIHIQPHLDRA